MGMHKLLKFLEEIIRGHIIITKMGRRILFFLSDVISRAQSRETPLGHKVLC